MDSFFSTCEDFNKKFMKRRNKKRQLKVHHNKSDVLSDAEVQRVLDSIDQQNQNRRESNGREFSV